MNLFQSLPFLHSSGRCSTGHFLYFAGCRSIRVFENEYAFLMNMSLIVKEIIIAAKSIMDRIIALRELGQ